MKYYIVFGICFVVLLFFVSINFKKIEEFIIQNTVSNNQVDNLNSEYESLIDLEKKEIKKLFETIKTEKIIDFIYVNHFVYCLTDNNNIYYFRPYEAFNDTGVQFKLFLDGSIAFGEKILSIDTSLESDYNFHLKVENQGYIFFKLSTSRYPKKYPESNWRILDYFQNLMSSYHYYNFINFFDNTDYAKEYDNLFLINNYRNQNIFTLDSKELRTFKIVTDEMEMKIEDNTGISHNEFSGEIQKIENVGPSYNRITIMTDSGYMYSRGHYGPYDYLGEHSRFHIIRMYGDESKGFNQLDLTSIDDPIIDFSSNIYYDVILTENSTFLHGLIPSKIQQEGLNDHIDETILREIKYNGKSLNAKQIQCSTDVKCYALTKQDEILVMGSRNEEGYFGRDDKWISFEFESDSLSISEIDFNKTFSTHKSLIVDKSGNLYAYVPYEGPSSNIEKIPDIARTITFNDYLKIRRKIYSENISEEIVRNYFKNISSRYTSNSSKD